MSIDIQPLDEHNQALIDHTHPADWPNPEPDNPYNMVVIGAGTAGLVSAAGAAGLGARVALVERSLMGGDCLNYGCVPSKGLIRCATAAADVRDAGVYGVEVGGPAKVDFGVVMERMRKLRARISKNDSAQRFKDLGVDVFLGDGRFTGPGAIEVAGKTLRYKKAVIATGARASAPPIPGLEEIDYLTNETLFNLTEQPRRLGIIGAGPIGCEMAQTFQRLGTQVWLMELTDHVLPREDADAAAIVQDELRRDGVNLVLNAEKINKVSNSGDAVTIRYFCGEKKEECEVTVDRLLVAVGRAPNVTNMGLESVGVQFDPRKGVIVDDTLRTTNLSIFAAGDVCSKFQFTHAADFLARIVINNALFDLRVNRQKASSLVIPWCTYTDPQIAHVGLSAHDAAAQSIDIDTFTQPLEDVDRAILDGETKGFVKFHVAKGTDQILGGTIVARHAGDMIGEIVMAMTHSKKIRLGGIASVIHPYPTQAEAIRRAGDLYNRTRLTPTVKKWMDRWMRWQRGK